MKTGTIMAEVVVDVGGQEVVAGFAEGSVERLPFDAGDRATVIVQATQSSPGFDSR